MPSFHSRRFGLALLVALSALATAAPVGARTRDKTASEPRIGKVETPPAKAKVVTHRPVAWTAADQDGRACSRTRRKLWQGNEGWMVRAVTVCP